jgi:hypothetical protein
VNKLRAWGANLSLLLVALMMTLGGFEIALRLFLPQKLYRFPKGLFRNDSDLVFTLVPGFRGTLKNPEYTTDVRINALGLRGALPGPKSSGGFRVLGLGDSFVSAFNVSEAQTFLSVAESRLRNETPWRSVEVVNAGTPNYGTWHELRLFQRLALRLDPDLAVLCVYVGNDLENNLYPQEAMVQGGFLTERRRQLGLLPYGFRTWLQRNSMSYVFLWQAWAQLRPWVGGRLNDPLRSDKNLFSRRQGPGEESGYRVTSDVLTQFKSEAERLKIPSTLVLIPTESQVYPDRFDKLVRKQGLEPARFDLELPQRRWSEIARSAGIPVLDLLPILKQRTSGPYLYMSLDGHLSVEGNRLVGEAIAEAARPWIANRSVGVAP